MGLQRFSLVASAMSSCAHCEWPTAAMEVCWWQQELAAHPQPRDKSNSSHTALLQVLTCSTRSVATLFSDGQEKGMDAHSQNGKLIQLVHDYFTREAENKRPQILVCRYIQQNNSNSFTTNGPQSNIWHPASSTSSYFLPPPALRYATKQQYMWPVHTTAAWPGDTLVPCRIATPNNYSLISSVW
jgi:hypothetical protein